MKKKNITFVLVLMIVFCLAGCGRNASDPGVPPEEVLHPQDSQTSSSEASGETDEASGKESESGMLENAVSVRIGRDGKTAYSIHMYDNRATDTMLGYLSGDGLLFPTYTYDEEEGYVAQSIRGSYTRDDEVEIQDIHAGELYLFSGGQLRLYFKDVQGANITATPIGIFADSSSVEEAVTDAYESNKGDTWGVDVYFWITKTMD